MFQDLFVFSAATPAILWSLRHNGGDVCTELPASFGMYASVETKVQDVGRMSLGVDNSFSRIICPVLLSVRVILRSTDEDLNAMEPGPACTRAQVSRVDQSRREKVRWSR